jgi:hypothetical protein
MKQSDFSKVQLSFAEGESVTVRVRPSGTAHLVAYNLDGRVGPLHEAESLKFIATNAGLGVHLGFSKSGGGSYVVEIFGERGYARSFRYEQLPGQSSKEVFYTIAVAAGGLEGDPTVDDDEENRGSGYRSVVRSAERVEGDYESSDLLGGEPTTDD